MIIMVDGIFIGHKSFKFRFENIDLPFNVYNISFYLCFQDFSIYTIGIAL